MENTGQSNYTPQVWGIIRFFKWSHLPPGPLQEVSKMYCTMADQTVKMTNAGPEQTVALRKLLEAKDASVRAALPVE